MSSTMMTNLHFVADWCASEKLFKQQYKLQSSLKELQLAPYYFNLPVTAGSHFIISSAIGPKVNLHYRLLLSSVLLIPLLSLCSYTVITSTSQHIRLYFLLQTLSSAYDSLLLGAWEHFIRRWALIYWPVGLCL